MISLQELLTHLDEYLGVKGFKDYCPNGLQVEGKRQVSRVAVAVSASLAAIEEAVKKEADVLIVHHGLFWDKEPHSVVGPKREKLQKLLTHELSLLAYHLPLDAHHEVGNNWKAARDLGFQNLTPFGLFNGVSIGVKGEFPPVPIEKLQERLEEYYGHIAHSALGGKKQVSSCALISGGAHRSILEAVQHQADCFVTGSFDEPIWDIAHEERIHFFALGHYATERVGVQALADYLHKRFHLTCTFIDFPNPF